RLTAAIQQVLSWKRWTERNLAECERLLPWGWDLSAMRTSFTIYIGKRQSSAAFLADRNAWSAQTGISIRSFDALSDSLNQRYFPNRYNAGTAQTDQLDEKLSNELVNPFSAAYSDAQWRDVVNDSRFHKGGHMVAMNAELLLSQRRHCASFSG